jgi:hypothetical protein
MSDPRYAHEFMPNRRGLCKYIVKYAHCGKPENASEHVRWAERVKRTEEAAAEEETVENDMRGEDL